MTGEEIAEGESYLKDRHLWNERHAERLVVQTAWATIPRTCRRE